VDWLKVKALSSSPNTSKNIYLLKLSGIRGGRIKERSRGGEFTYNIFDTL
jgi:hypothetical protein